MRKLLKAVVLLSIGTFIVGCHTRESEYSSQFKDSAVYSRILKIGKNDPELASRVADSAVSAGKLSPVISNVAKSVLWLDNSRNKLSSYYANKALQDSSLKNYSEYYNSIIKNLVDISYQDGNYGKSVSLSQQGLDYARMRNDTTYIGYFLFTIGRSLAKTTSKDRAYSYFYKSQQAYDKMLKSRDAIKIEMSAYTLTISILMMRGNGDFQDALKLTSKLDTVVDALSACKNADVSMLDMRKGTLHYLKALLFYQIGNKKESTDEFEKLLATSFASTEVGVAYQADYYRVSHQNVEALKMYNIFENIYKAQHDTMSFEFVNNIVVPKFQIYHLLGEDRKAVYETIRGKSINDSCHKRMMVEDANEVNVAYETSQKEEQLKAQESQITFMKFLIGAFAIIVILLVIFAVRVYHYNRIISKKNASAVDTISRMLSYKDKLESYENKANEETVETESESQLLLNSSENEEVSDEPVDVDKQMFERIAFLISSKKLYLQPKLSREDIIKLSKCPRNKFAQLFNQYAGMSFNKYINDLRLDYAAKLLRDKPEYTIEAVAIECGLPIAQTFYRNFSEKFGVTPNDFRNNIK